MINAASGMTWRLSRDCLDISPDFPQALAGANKNLSKPVSSSIKIGVRIGLQFFAYNLSQNNVYC